MSVVIRKNRRATTLIELVLFIAIFAICSTVILGIFFASTEQRARQKIIMNVEHSGMQMMQTVLKRIRTAERILSPAPGETDEILALQIATESLNPTIFAEQAGALIAVQASTHQTLSTDIVTIDSFSAENTSVSADRQSVRIRMVITGTIPLIKPITYTRTFESTVALYPNDSPDEHCLSACALPVCDAGTYKWDVCEAGSCVQKSTLTCT